MTTATAPLTITAEPGSHAVITEREVAAPRDVLFRCYTDPTLLAKWLGPRKYEMRVEAFDLRDGGRWRYVHADPATGAEYVFHGVFHGEPSPDGWAQTFEFLGAPGYVSLDTLQLVDRGGRTLVRTTSVYQSVEARDAMVARRHGGRHGRRATRASTSSSVDSSRSADAEHRKELTMDCKLEVVVVPGHGRGPGEGVLRRPARLPGRRGQLAAASSSGSSR